MKILFNYPAPFALAHGGAQIQIEQTMRSLQAIGVEVEPLRWWDSSQNGDAIYQFGRMPFDLIQLAHAKNIKIVTTELLTAQGSRGPWKLAAQQTLNGLLRNFAPAPLTNAFQWQAYALADACVALTDWEASLMRRLFDAPPDKVFVVPNGVEMEFLNSTPRERGPWLVCTATITERKRIAELAEAAVLAQTPVWIVGKPYSTNDPYGQRFLKLAQAHPRFIRYDGPITGREQMAVAYREARGFVLLSTMESLSLSALEASACECPLLLSDLPWARTVFKDKASYCPIAGARRTAQALRAFYDDAPSLPRPHRPLNWEEVARQLRSVYERALSTSR